jgi:hypothetical protein
MIPNVKQLSIKTREHFKGKYSLYLGETRRTIDVQMAYYARGRASTELVKAYFKRCGLWELTDVQAQTKSTETLYSKHIDGLAIDAYLYDIASDKILWDVAPCLWEELFEIAEEECGLDACAGRKWNAWQWDWPHFEWKSFI